MVTRQSGLQEIIGFAFSLPFGRCYTYKLPENNDMSP